MMPDRMSVLVVDDEAPARQRLTDLLRSDGRISEVLEAGDGRKAVSMLIDRSVDLVFLDIQMPELTGIEVIRQIGSGRMPLTVFVTAYDKHAVQAFEANALDYLLKPFSDSRFVAALDRAAARLAERRTHEFAHGLVQLMAARPPEKSHLDRLLVRSSGSIQLVRTADIEWIEGAGSYVNLHIAGALLLHRGSLTELLTSLDPGSFVRVHRSAVVNINSIVRLETVSHGEFDALLRSGARCRVSRTWRPELEKRLGQIL